MIQLNGIDIVPTIFPDKTSQVWKLNEKEITHCENYIVWIFENESEFIHLAQLVDLLKEISMGTITLDIPYFPYARQDKEINNTSTFALRTFCSLLKSLSVNKIVTLDIHSNIAKEYLPNLTSIFPTAMIDHILGKESPKVIVFPDKGAKARYKDNFMGNFVTILKKRDQLTGHLKIIGIEGAIDLLKDSKVLIVDDLCDGGMTFILAAKYLKELDTKEVLLYTTHGIYSKGVEVLKENGISKVFNHNGEV